ncbi:hypothetical protein MB46_07180 [Arthrobacter alpinus]|uniref:hypothetical protein n=1 Tax=Arthrobacter alpinus TaxID=656366 RepID=UPI0005CA4981|nr:hypothetical protein [Arthrobacter alpinus]ALV45310.1 hypothetical protein MB46_07180 [Arthrobacter alpinus]
MASQRVETCLRIAGGLVVIILAVVSLVLMRTHSPDVLPRIAISLAAAAAIFWGFTVVVGRTRSGRIVLTRRRWKYGLLIGVIVVYAVLVVAVHRPASNLGFAVFPIGVAIFVGQLFESETVAAAPMVGAVTDRNVRSWRRIALVTAVVGGVLCCVSAMAAFAGNLSVVALLLPVAIVSLVFAAVFWVWLRSIRRQVKGR